MSRIGSRCRRSPGRSRAPTGRRCRGGWRRIPTGCWRCWIRPASRGTFFTLGWVAERHPALVRRIVAGGHELASHGFWHGRADAQTPAEFAADVGRARAVLEDAGGVAVAGYRAPTFSIGPGNAWAWDVLAEQGHRYSSSVYPVRHDLYGTPDAPRFRASSARRRRPAGNPDDHAARAPGATCPAPAAAFSACCPTRCSGSACAASNAARRSPACSTSTRGRSTPVSRDVPAASRRSRFRHRVNLAATERRLGRLLRDFAWDRMDRVFAPALAGLLPGAPAGALAGLPPGALH